MEGNALEAWESRIIGLPNWVGTAASYIVGANERVGVELPVHVRAFAQYTAFTHVIKRSQKNYYAKREMISFLSTLSMPVSASEAHYY